MTYNQEKWISYCLDSVVNQVTNFNFEIIVGVDLSIDNTLSIVMDYARNYSDKIKIIEQKQRIGPFLNAKVSLEGCAGEYVAFMNGDDYWQDRLKLQKQISFLEANPEYGMVHSDYDLFYQKINKRRMLIHKTRNINIPSGIIFDELLKNNFIQTSTVLIKKELLNLYDDYDFYISKGFKMADYPRWIEVSRHTKIGYINESLITYRIVEESMSHSTSEERRLNFLTSMQDIKQYFIEKYGCNEQTKRDIASTYWRRRLILASILSRKDIATEAIKKLREFDHNLLEKIKLIIYLGGAYLGWLSKIIRHLIHI